MAAHFRDTCSAPDTSTSDHEEDVRAFIGHCDRETEQGIDIALNADFTAAAVKGTFSRLRLQSAMGPDDIPPSFLRHAPDSLIALLTALFNYSWHHGVLPRAWRDANLFALFKGGRKPKTDPSSFRPISLTSTTAKAFERLILTRLWSSVGHKISKNQAGFRKHHSTVDQIYRVLNAIRGAWSVHESLPIAFLDISKAFDRVWVDGLLFKLHTIGIRGRSWRWLRAFLTDRRMRIAYNGVYSEWVPLFAGTPQGSVVSPSSSWCTSMICRRHHAVVLSTPMTLPSCRTQSHHTT